MWLKSEKIIWKILLLLKIWLPVSKCPISPYISYISIIMLFIQFFFLIFVIFKSKVKIIGRIAKIKYSGRGLRNLYGVWFLRWALARVAWLKSPHYTTKTHHHHRLLFTLFILTYYLHLSNFLFSFIKPEISSNLVQPWCLAALPMSWYPQTAAFWHLLSLLADSSAPSPAYGDFSYPSLELLPMILIVMTRNVLPTKR